MRKIVLLLGMLSFFLEAGNLVIGSGSTKGVYYPTAVGICGILNQNSHKCVAKSTSGSIYNILHTVRTKKLTLAIAQSDSVYFAYHNKKKAKHYKKLRTIMSIYPELLTLIVTKKSKLGKLADVLNENVKISTGKIGSGTKSSVELLAKEVLGIKNGRIPTGLSVAIKDVQLYLESKIDGFFYFTGHPNKNIAKICAGSKAKFINLNSKKIGKMVKKYPYYTFGKITKGTYKCLKRDIFSYGVKANLIVNADMSEYLVKKITKALLDNFEELKKSHPALKYITKESLTEGLGAPMHKGAIAVFEENGLL